MRDYRRAGQVSDTITLRRAIKTHRPPQSASRRTHLWTMAGGITGSICLLWVMVQLGQASSEPQPHSAKPAGDHAVPAVSAGTTPAIEADAGTGASLAGPGQGPAIETPREIIDMLDQRKAELDRREKAVRQEEERLAVIKTELEGLLTKSQAMQKQIDDTRQAHQKAVQEQKAQQERYIAERKALAVKQAQDQKNQTHAKLAKMYESMPSEEAAARIEKMSEHKAIEILRIVKPKTAGAILSQVRVERAAKLTEQLLVPTP